MKIKTLIISLLISAGFPAPFAFATAETTPPPEKTVTHVVIARLKNPGDAASQEKLINASKDLAKIPGVISVRAGTPLPSKRSVVISDYDVGIVMEFKNEQALRDYDHHPDHKKAVEEILKPLVEGFVIYDFRNE